MPIIWLSENIGFAPYGEKVESDVFLLDVRDLVDRKGNDLNILRNKINIGAEILRNGGKLVVCCDKGISRSAVISIGIMSLLGTSFDKSLKLVAGQIGDQSLNLDLLEDVRKCVASETFKKTTKVNVSKIFVTGGTGYIGRAFIEKLSSKYFFFAPKQAEIDLTKDVLLLYREVKNRDVDFVVHLAHPRSQNSLHSLAKSIVMARNVLEMCRLNDLPFLFFSSMDVFEGYHDNSVSHLKSNLRPKPTSIFGQSKALCEELIRLYRETYGLNLTTLRLPYIYGGNMTHTNFLCKSIANALDNKSITVHRYLNGFQQFDFLQVDDLIDAIEKTILLAPSDDINLGTGKGTSTMDAAKLIVELAESKSKLKVIGVNAFAANLVPDTKKAQEMLNWTAETSFTQALRDLIHNR